MKGLGESVVEWLVGKPKPGAPVYLDQLIERLKRYYGQGKAFLGSATGTLRKSYQTGKSIATDPELRQRVREGWKQQDILKGLMDEKTRKKLGLDEPSSR